MDRHLLAAGLAVAALGTAQLAGAADAPVTATGNPGLVSAAGVVSSGWTMDHDCAKPEVRVVLVGGALSPGDALIIGGCGFGPGQGQAYLVGNFPGGKTKLVIESWTHKGIGAHVSDSLSGAPDQVATLRVVTKAGLLSNTDKRVSYDDGL